MMEEKRLKNIKSKKPNFFIIGFPKTGTTSLYNILKQHPEIFIVDHGSYFNKDFPKHNNNRLKSDKDYLELFSKVKDEKAIGDSSEGYVYSKIDKKKKKKFNSDAKIIMILREPVDWLRSAYQQSHRNLKEKRPIKKAVKSREYTEKVKYKRYIKKWIETSPKKNIKIIIFKDFKKDNLGIIREIFRFLEVDDAFIPKIEKKNPSKALRFEKLQFLLDKIGLKRRTFKKIFPEKVWKLVKEIGYKKGKIQIPEKTKKELSKKIKPEVEKTDKLLHEKGFLAKERSLVYEWGYQNV